MVRFNHYRSIGRGVFCPCIIRVYFKRVSVTHSDCHCQGAVVTRSAPSWGVLVPSFLALRASAIRRQGGGFAQFVDCDGLRLGGRGLVRLS